VGVLLFESDSGARTFIAIGRFRYTVQRIRSHNGKCYEEFAYEESVFRGTLVQFGRRGSQLEQLAFIQLSKLRQIPTVLSDQKQHTEASNIFATEGTFVIPDDNHRENQHSSSVSSSPNRWQKIIEAKRRLSI